jgi:hypothetical protein
MHTLILSFFGSARRIFSGMRSRRKNRLLLRRNQPLMIYPRFRLHCILLPLILLFSCTVTKRTHLPGYHVEWRKPLPKTETAAATLEAIRGQEPDMPVGTPVPAAETPSNDSLIPQPGKETIVRLPVLKQRRSFSPARVIPEKTVLSRTQLPSVKKHGIQHRDEARVKSRGGFERFLLLLLLAIVLVPVILLVMVFSVATFNVQSVLLGLLLLLLLVVLIVALIF